MMMKSDVNKQKTRVLNILSAVVLLAALGLSQRGLGQVSIAGSWETGTSHTKEAGTDRALIFIAHAEENGSVNLDSVTYGGQTMEPVTDEIIGTDYRAYVAAFILDEAGITAASSGTFTPVWSTTPDNVSYASVFFENVDQTNAIGACDNNSTTSSDTLTTTSLSTDDGDMVIVAATCGNMGSYTVNSGFTEALEHSMASSTGTAGYKSATGVAETPSVTHDDINRQVIIGFVIQGIPADPNIATNPDPANSEDGVAVSSGLSWDGPAAYTPSSYDVYFGTDSNTHNNPKYTVYTNNYDPPGDLEYGTTYYWAVDSNNGGTIYHGNGWSFTSFVSVTVGDLVADYILSQALTGHYASACSYYGVLLYSEVTGDTSLKDSVIAAFPSSYYTGATMPPEGSQDDNAYGILPFELYRQTGDANYLTSALYLADKEFENPLPNGLANYDYTRFWIDDTYMIGSLQAQAYKSTGDITYANHAVTQLLGYMGEVEQLQQSNGLFHHTTSAPIHWGRGNGWAAAAMTEVLLAIPEDDPNRPSLLSKYQAMMAGLVNCQDANGMWYQVLDMGSDPRNWAETSCTGMFVFALATGVKEGWLPEVPYKQAALNGWSALENYVDEQGRVHEVCMWMSASSDVNYYFDRPREIGNVHGQAAAIWAATAIERLNSEAEVVDFDDLKMLADNWLGDEPAADIFPPEGDGIINFLDFAELAEDWMK